MEKNHEAIREKVILGGQFGDEGKGKIVDALAKDADLIVRYQGGANAGHTVVVKNYESGIDEETILHLLPSGVLHSNKLVALGPEVVVDLTSMYEDELEKLLSQGSGFADIYLSPDINLVTNTAKFLDIRANKIYDIGTTARGIGPTYGNLVERASITLKDVLYKTVSELANKLEKQAAYNGLNEEEVIKGLQIFGEKKLGEAKYSEQIIHAKRLINSESFTQEAISMKKDLERILDSRKVVIKETRLLLEEVDTLGGKVLKEGAQGVLLDVNHGYSPYVTSSSVANADNNVGYPSLFPKTKIGVFKAYTTKVGNGPFPTKLEDEVGEYLREKGNEYGATTKRPRDTGWFDVPLAKYAIQVAGINEIALTKLDVLSGLENLKIAVGYNGLSKEELFTRKPEYEILDGWNEDISNAISFEELPTNAQNYVLRLSELLKTPISFIGNGKERQSLIYKESH